MDRGSRLGNLGLSTPIIDERSGRAIGRRYESKRQLLAQTARLAGPGLDMHAPGGLRVDGEHETREHSTVDGFSEKR